MQTNQKIMRNIAAGVIRAGRMDVFSFACKGCGEIVVANDEEAKDFTGLCPDCLEKQNATH